jgi:hypothetical protein
MAAMILVCWLSSGGKKITIPSFPSPTRTRRASASAATGFPANGKELNPVTASNDHRAREGFPYRRPENPPLDFAREPPRSSRAMRLSLQLVRRGPQQVVRTLRGRTPRPATARRSGCQAGHEPLRTAVGNEAPQSSPNRALHGSKVGQMPYRWSGALLLT